MMSFLALIFFLGFLCVRGTPSQLRLSHSGYEIISFNDQIPDENVSTISKLALRNNSHYNGIGLLNLEKATDPMDDSEESTLSVQQPNKPNYESQRWDSGPKMKTGLHQNMIVLPSKESSNSATRRVYLTVGMPGRSINPENQRKDSSNAYETIKSSESNLESKNFFDASNHRETVKREKFIVPSINSKNKSKKYSNIMKSKIKSVKNDFHKDPTRSKILESDNESTLNLDRIKALVLDSHSDLDFVVAKSDSHEKSEKIETPSVKSQFPIIAKFPTIQIHNQRSFWVPPRGPAMFSPIYPSGFDILSNSDIRHKSIFPFGFPALKDSQNLPFDSSNLSRKVDCEVQLDGRKNEAEHESNDVASGKREIEKTLNQDSANLRFPSIVLMKNLLTSMSDDLSNHRDENRMPLNLAEFLPFSGSSVNVMPLTLMNQRSSRPSEGHQTTNSMPLIANHIENKHPRFDLSIFQRPTEDFHPLTGSERPRPRNNDSNLNLRYEMTGSKGVIAKKLVDKLNTTSLHQDLVIDIVQETIPDDYETSNVDLNADSTKCKCKKMRNVANPGFYQFLTKFSDVVLEKALEYESNRNALKLIDTTKKNTDNDILHHTI